jgi:hypothetical protein
MLYFVIFLDSQSTPGKARTRLTINDLGQTFGHSIKVWFEQTADRVAGIVGVRFTRMEHRSSLWAVSFAGERSSPTVIEKKRI